MSADKGAGGVHRLVDMVVEEVSLVDRAANKHRFLIVKRDDAMDDNTDSTGNTQKATSDGTSNTSCAVADGSPLGAALSALESLTAIVELLGSLGADTTDTRLAALAQQLRATAEQILERTGFAEAPASEEADTVEARAKAGELPPAASLEAHVTAAKQVLSRLAELIDKALPAKAQKSEEPPPGEKAGSVADSLAKLAESFRTLSETVKEQQQRLGRVEKHFGLPNSAAPAGKAPAATDEDVGWPMDLNKPLDREHVDKAVSFHEP